MAVKFKSKKEPKSLAKEAADTALHQKVDDYVEAQAELAKAKKALKPLETKVGGLKADLLVVAESHPADESVTLEGYEHEVVAGMKGNKTTVVAEVDEVFDILGEDTFKLVVSFGITALKKYASKAQLEDIIKVERTGARPLKVLQ